MASAEGGAQATDEIPEGEIAIMERPSEDLGRVGLKRVRDFLDGKGSHGTHGERMLPDRNTRWSISSPGENLGHKIKRPTKICTFYAQGRCNKGNSCTSLHEIEDPGSDYRGNNEEKASLLTADAYGNSRGSKEGSQVQCLSSMKVLQSKDSDGSTEDDLYRSLIHVYGENDRSVHGADKRSIFSPGASHGTSSRIADTLTKKLTNPINELVSDPVVYQENQEPTMGHHSGLTPESYLDGKVTSPRLLDGGFFQSAADKGTYLEVNKLDSKYRYRSFDLPIPSNPLHCNEKFSASGGTTGNLPNTHHIENLSSHAPYSSYNLPVFRNPLYAISNHSFGSPTFRATSHVGRPSHHLSAPVIEKVGHHKYVDVGTGTSRPALLPSSSNQPSIMSPGSLSPIKDEVWVTSVPFVPSFDIPDIKTPSRSQYDPFVDSIDSPKDGIKNNLKSSSISSQHTNPYVLTPKSLNHDDKLAKNISAKASNELACLIASYKGHSSSLDDNTRVKVNDKKPDAASNNEKTRDFRFCLAEHVKELIKPLWKKGYLSKDAHKLVVKKSMDKILSTIEPHQVPTSKEAISNYITTSESKIEKLVKAYVDKLRNRAA